MSGLMVKVHKLIAIATRPALWRYAIRGVAPATEHIGAMQRLKIGTCIDVGANLGQFSAIIGYTNPEAKIFAFEPMPKACATYGSLFQGNQHTLLECGAGKVSGEIKFHMTDRADSSSFLTPGANQTLAFGVKEVQVLDLPIRRVDEQLDEARLTRPVLLKIDVQGLELDVVEGAKKLLHAIDYCYVELSFVELYEGQPLASEVLQALISLGFKLVGVFNQTETPSFGPTQADFLLAKAA